MKIPKAVKNKERNFFICPNSILNLNKQNKESQNSSKVLFYVAAIHDRPDIITQKY